MCIWSNKPTNILINNNNYYYFIIIVVTPAAEEVLATTESCTSSLPAVAGVKTFVPEAQGINTASLISHPAFRRPRCMLDPLVCHAKLSVLTVIRSNKKAPIAFLCQRLVNQKCGLSTPA